jgi:hypothetical protein
MERINKPIVQRSGNDAIYGNGTDGDATINNEVTITSDMYYNNLTVSSTGFLRTNGFRIFVKGTLTIELGGKIGIGPNNSGVDPSDVSTGTVSGHTTSAISYRIGGQGGGGTNPNIPTLPSFLLKNVNNLSNGLIFDPNMGIVPLQGGSRGTNGSTGATIPALTNSDNWPGKVGAEGTPGSISNYNNSNPNANTVGVAGGKGNPASPGNANGATPGLGGAGGSGGSGGPVVCIVAKTITGFGSIVANGKKGGAGSPGLTGNHGTQGANGTPAPNNSHHVSPSASPHHHSTPGTHHTTPHHHTGPAHHVPYTHIPAGTNYGNVHNAPHADHNTHSTYSDFHAHAVKAANHHAPASHTAASGKTPAHHTAAAHHENPHYHHAGGGHHPHNDGPHGGMHHWYGASWHRRYQVSHSNAINHNHVKPNTHATAYVGSNGVHNSQFAHQHSGGTNNNVHHGHAIIGHAHPGNHHVLGGGHHALPVPAPFSQNNYVHHVPHYQQHLAPHVQQHHGNPDQVFPGGAGGVNDGISTGRAAPAVTGGSGKQGGYGGGGAILVITDSVSGTITYDTSTRTGADTDNFSASNGSAYILVNQ